MQNKRSDTTELDLSIPTGQSERRKKHRTKDAFFILVMILNIISWVLLVSALLVFHYARPEFITGVQDFWGIEGREYWSETHLQHLLTLLQFCLVTALVSIILRTRRSRRKTDTFGYNLLFLLIISVVSLATLYSIV